MKPAGSLGLVAGGVFVAGAVLVAISSRRKARTFAHDGQTYTRQRNGGFLDSGGVPVAGAALLGALAVAHQQHLERVRASSPSDSGGGDSSSSGWWGGDCGGGDCGGGGDGGGGGD